MSVRSRLSSHVPQALPDRILDGGRSIDEQSCRPLSLARTDRPIACRWVPLRFEVSLLVCCMNYRNAPRSLPFPFTSACFGVPLDRVCADAGFLVGLGADGCSGGQMRYHHCRRGRQPCLGSRTPIADPSQRRWCRCGRKTFSVLRRQALVVVECVEVTSAQTSDVVVVMHVLVSSLQAHTPALPGAP